MGFTSNILLLATALFLGMLLAMELGRRIGIAMLARNQETTAQGTGATEGAVFGLLGLLIAFTFSGAASRFEGRRHLIADETNAIGTAYLRVDLLAAEAQPPMRELFRHYLDGRIAFYASLADPTAAPAMHAASTALQGKIWTGGVAAIQQPGAASDAGLLFLPALNEMIDITTTQLVALANHPPRVIFVQLALLGLVAALISGYGMAGNKGRSWLHCVVFALMISLTLFLVMDLEYPRRGLIQVDAVDAPLIELRASMQ